jgi:hypothetical protein
MLSKKVYQKDKDPEEIQRIEFELDQKARKQREEQNKNNNNEQPEDE